MPLSGWAGRAASGCNPALQGCSDATCQMWQQGGNQILSPIRQGWPQAPVTTQHRAEPGRPCQSAGPLALSHASQGGVPSEAGAAQPALQLQIHVPLPTQPGPSGPMRPAGCVEAAGRTGPPLKGSCWCWAPLIPLGSCSCGLFYTPLSTRPPGQQGPTADGGGTLHSVLGTCSAWGSLSRGQVTMERGLRGAKGSSCLRARA